MPYTVAPCKGCTDRSIEPVNCHMVCEKYLEFAKEKRAHNAVKDAALADWRAKCDRVRDTCKKSGYYTKGTRKYDSLY